MGVPGDKTPGNVTKVIGTKSGYSYNAWNFAGGMAMSAFNAVRFRVKPGRDHDFLEAHKKVERNWPGLRHANIIKTGESTYCIIAEWDDMDALANARPHMIATLGSFRDTLEDLGGGLGVTDPVSGPVVLALK
jgi:Antibiotic biosynthesis monooxygenase